MSKPIKDYTLGEAKEICDKYMADCETMCVGCPLQQWCDKMTRTENYVPGDWDFSEPPRWTQKEVERAKALKVILPEAMTLNRGDLLIAVCPEQEGLDDRALLSSNTFPSLKPGETVMLEEIICGK